MEFLTYNVAYPHEVWENVTSPECITDDSQNPSCLNKNFFGFNSITQINSNNLQVYFIFMLSYIISIGLSVPLLITAFI